MAEQDMQRIGMTEDDLALQERRAKRADQAAAFASWLNSMRMTPDENLPAQLQAAQESRASNIRKNRTVNMLESAGQTELAKQVKSGAITGKTAVAQMFELGREERAAQRAAAASARSFQNQMKLAEYKQRLSGGQEIALLQNLPKPEQGKMYEFDRDENNKITNVRLVNIEGGKAAQEEKDRQDKLGKTRTMEERGQGVVNKSVKEALRIISEDTGLIPVAGTYGKFAADYLPDQEARNLKRTLEALQANTAFTRLQEMRDASKTGGALGNVSNVELGLLMSAYGSITQDLEPDLLRKNLNEIKRLMGKIESDPVASAFYNEGIDLRGSDLDAQVKSNQSQGAKRLRFDAEGNLIND